MVYHILNGDALIKRFLLAKLSGEMVVTRECLVEGDLEGNSYEEFYKTRAKYIGATYGENEKTYFSRVVSEFKKLMAAEDNSVFNLWFGYDLFCRANMWFILSLLHDLPIQKSVFVVYPSYLQGSDVWKDFGSATPEDLITCFEQRIQLANADLRLGKDLWTAFKNGDLIQLDDLCGKPSACFPYLKEVCRAHIDRFPDKGEKGRPEKAIEALINERPTDFNSVFNQFYEREGVYGFGDLQVRRIYDRVVENR